MILVLHSIAVYLILMLVLRIMGKRELAEMSPIDMVVLFVVGDLITEAVISEDTSVVGAVTVMSVFAVMTVGLSWLTTRWQRLERALDGVPTVIVRDGELDLAAMRAERVTLDDLNEAARDRSIRSLSDIELAVLESDGKFSFFTRTEG